VGIQQTNQMIIDAIARVKSKKAKLSKMEDITDEWIWRSCNRFDGLKWSSKDWE
jgi:hypothetical protein